MWEFGDLQSITKASQAFVRHVRIVQTIFCACLASLKRGALVCNTSGNLLIGMPRCRNASFTYENEQKSDPEKKNDNDEN